MAHTPETNVLPAAAEAEAHAARKASRATVAGIGLMVLGIFLFSVNDVMGKWLVATYSVGQVLLMRSVAALLLLAPFIIREGTRGVLWPSRPGLQLMRVFFATFEVACFYAAVAYLPLADVMTYYLAGPIYVTALSALILRERVGWRRWSAVAVGFSGVVIALGPSAAGLSWPAIIAFTGSMLYALFMITTRSLKDTSGTTLIVWQTIGALVFGLVTAPFQWVAPTGLDFALLSLLGAVAMLGHICTNGSLKLAPASVVVPYQYTLIVWAVVFGYFVFGDVPGLNMLVGAAIIVAAGLFVFLREQKLMRQAQEPSDR